MLIYSVEPAEAQMFIIYFERLPVTKMNMLWDVENFSLRL